MHEDLTEFFDELIDGDEVPCSSPSDGDENPAPDWNTYTPDPPNFSTEDTRNTDTSPLFEGSTITVIAACAYLWSLSKRCKWRREHLQRLLGFMHSHLLPEGNRMPKTCYMLEQVIGRCSMGDFTYRMCPDGCIVWHRRDEMRMGIRCNTSAECPKCHQTLFKESRGSVVPKAQIFYFGISSMIRYFTLALLSIKNRVRAPLLNFV